MKEIACSSVVPYILKLSISTSGAARGISILKRFDSIVTVGDSVAGMSNAKLTKKRSPRSRVHRPSTGPSLSGRSMFLPATPSSVREKTVLDGFGLITIS